MCQRRYSKPIFSIKMPPKRTPLTCLENEPVVKRRWATTAKTSSIPSNPVKTKLHVPRTKVLKPSEKELLEKLPIPPEFNYFQSPFPPHYSPPLLLEVKQNCSPIDLFCLFFSNTILDLIVTNTNRYAELKWLLFCVGDGAPAQGSDKETGLGLADSGSVRNGLGARAAPRGNCQEDWTGPDDNFYSVPSWDILGLQG